MNLGPDGPGQRPDPTEQVRRELIPRVPSLLADAIARGEKVWSPAELARDFEVLGFMVPFVVVQRRDDGMRGSLLFTGHPRQYFGWQPEVPEPSPAPELSPLPARFALGQMAATPGAIETMQRLGIHPMQLFARHVMGDWGDTSPDGRWVNEQAVAHGGRIMSWYGARGDPDQLLVVTEEDRSTTTILRSDEY